MTRFKTILVMWALLVSFPVFSQEPNPTAKATSAAESIPAAKQNEPQRLLSPVQEQAVALLRSLFEASSSVTPGTLKVSLQARIADTLWTYDQQFARRAFEEALKEIDSVSGANEDRSPLSANQDVHFRSQLRRGVSEIIARVDPDWAKTIALSNIKTSDSKTKVRLDYHSIMSLTESDPRRAAELLTESLDVHEDATLLREVLMKIRPKHPALADDAFAYALSLAERNLSQPFDYFFEAFDYVFPNAKRQDESVSYASSVAAAPIDDGLIRRFLEFGYRAIMQEAGEIEQRSTAIDERAAYGYEYVLGMLPCFLPYMPEQAKKMRERWDTVIGNLPGGKKDLKELNLLLNPPNVESLLRHAKSAKNQDEKIRYYLLAAHRAVSDGNFDRAFAILDKLPDQEARRAQTENFRVRAAEAALAKSDLDNAYRYGQDVVEPYQRIEIIKRVLLALVEKKDNTRANAILDEALKGVAKDDDVRSRRANALVTFAEIAFRVNPERGFEIMKSAVEALNRARMSDGKAYVVDIYEFDSNLLLLARVDFAKALTLAQLLNDENSLLAQLAVCRGALTIPN